MRRGGNPNNSSGHGVRRLLNINAVPIALCNPCERHYILKNGLQNEGLKTKRLHPSLIDNAPLMTLQ